MTTTAPETTRPVDWADIGQGTVPPTRRDEFLTVADELTWHAPEGDHPFSPAHALMAVIREFGIRPVTAIAYSGMWEAPDGPETATYTVLGVRTRKQTLLFVDEGVQITPVAFLPYTPEAAA